MKAFIKKSLCEKLGLSQVTSLTCKAIFFGDYISAIEIKDGIKTFILASPTKEFAMAKSLFGVNERIRTPDYIYKL